MLGLARTTAGLIGAVAATIPLALAQLAILKSGKGNHAIMPRLWHKACLRVIGIRVRRVGTMALDRPLLLAANHVSWTDIHVLGSLENVVFVAKSDVGRWPVIGSLSRLQRTVFIDRNRRNRTREQAREIAGRLAGGDAVVLFAEGTTGDGNYVLPFRSTLFGAAAFAMESGAERILVQPVAIAYTRFHGMPMGRAFRRRASWIGDQELLPHLVRLLREGGMDAEVRFGTPIELRADLDRKQVAQQAEQEVRRMLSDALRSGDASI